MPNRSIRAGTFGLGMVLKEIHLAYSTRFAFRESDLYLVTWPWSSLICTGKVFCSVHMGLRERMYFITFVYLQVLKFFSSFIFHYFLFIYMFPFCLHVTSALYKVITIFFCIIMFLNFCYVFEIFICFRSK